MTPEQWLNVANCARRRYNAVGLAAGYSVGLSYWLRRDGELRSWMMAESQAGRCSDDA